LRGCFPHAGDYLKVRLKMLPNFLLLVEIFDMNNISLIKVKLSFISSCRTKIPYRSFTLGASLEEINGDVRTI